MTTIEQEIRILAMIEAAGMCTQVAVNIGQRVESTVKHSVRLEFLDQQIGALKCQSAIWQAIMEKSDAVGPGVPVAASEKLLPPTI